MASLGKFGRRSKQEMTQKLKNFAKELHLNQKSLDEIVNLSIQLVKIMNDLNPELKVDIFK